MQFFVSRKRFLALILTCFGAFVREIREQRSERTPALAKLGRDTQR
jgi:hypothetical protein